MTRAPQPPRYRRPFVAGLVWLFLVTGCGADPPQFAASAASPPLAENVFLVGYNRISEIYLTPVDMGRLALDGLSGLRRLEPGWSVERSEKNFRVTVRGEEAARFDAPGPEDADGWAQVTARAIEAGRSYSDVLRNASADDLYEAVFDAVVGDLDIYSRYTRPTRAGQERAQREGFGGIGLTIDRIDGRMVVRSVEPKTPAQRAGIAPGTVVDTVDGEPVAGWTVSDLVERLRGPIGTLVRVTLADSGGRVLQLRRERVIPNTVALSLDGLVAVLKVERFNAATTANLREAILTATERLGRSPAGYVLDLRGNPGGLLDQAVAVADLFIRRGRIISTAGRHPDSWQRFDATPEDIADGLPLVVLVDGRSASSSEIVAAALQDSRRAVVVGASSYGKGSVQTVTRLPNDAELFLTWARLYAPSGYTLHRQGVLPTVCTSRDGADVAAVLDDFRRGTSYPSAALLALRGLASEDDDALAQLRATCPWKAHEPKLDLEVAEALLTDKTLYMAALNMTVVAER